MSFRRHFQLKLNPIGVKFLSYEDENATVEDRFCETVRKAANKRVVVKAFHCAGAELSLFSESSKESESILLEPYNERESYDVVLVIATPEKVMEIAKAYKQIFGEDMVAKFSGTRAVCGEATAEVLKSGKPNVTFLCEGARTLGGYSSEEVVIGFPAHVFKNFERELIAGRLKALCGCLTDDLPDHVKRKFFEMGFDKATDHFMGYFGGLMVDIYIFKGEILDRIAIHLKVKFRSNEEAEKVAEELKKLDEEFLVNTRENWVEISKILQLKKDIGRAVRNPEFERWLKGEIEKLSKKVKEFKNKKFT